MQDNDFIGIAQAVARGEFGAIGTFLQTATGKAVYFGMVLLSVIVMDVFLRRAAKRRVAQRGGDPTITLALARTICWTIGALAVMEPVFGVEPTGLIAALGVGSVVLSLGLQNSVSNFVAGLEITGDRVLQPGDIVVIEGKLGEVVDVNWQRTLISDREGDAMIVPNAEINRSVIMRRNADNRYLVSFEIEVVPTADLDAVAEDIRNTAIETLKTNHFSVEGLFPVVMFQGATAFGISCLIQLYVSDIMLFDDAVDVVMRALKQRDYLSDATTLASGIKDYL